MSRFGVDVNVSAMQSVPILFVIGESDADLHAVTIDETEPAWMPGINDSGTNRQERLEALRDSFERAGVRSVLVVVPDVGHEGIGVLGPVLRFFANVLSTD